MPGTDYIEAIILGVVQGIAEFLPISSSGHIVIASDLIQRTTGATHDPESNLLMNVALHLGTLFSILWVFRQQIVTRLKDWNYFIAVVIATIPLILTGLLLKDWIDNAFNEPIIAGCGLLVTAVFLLWGQRMERSEEQTVSLSERTEWGIACVVGLFQSIAICPGISRSGSTIAGGMVAGLHRDAAAAFSFFIAIPAIGGAALYKGIGACREPELDFSIGPLLIGMVVSFVVGLIALRWLLSIVTARKLHWFGYYCVIAGFSTIVWQLIIRWQEIGGGLLPRS